MIRMKSPLVQQALSGIMLVLILGALSMIWPGIIALCFGVLLLLQSCSAEQEILALSWAEVSSLPIAFASFRRPGLQAILS
jgi:hypothetical protein